MWKIKQVIYDDQLLQNCNIFKTCNNFQLLIITSQLLLYNYYFIITLQRIIIRHKEVVYKYALQSLLSSPK